MMPELIFHQHAAQMLIAEQQAAVAGGRVDRQPRAPVLLQSIVEMLSGRRARFATRRIRENGLPNIVGVSGSASPVSRTRSIIETTIGRIAGQVGANPHLISVADLTPHLGIAWRADAPPPVEEALRLIETADLLIVGSPVYKGSYTGLLKHLIDLVEYTSLAGVPVGLIATGGSDKHALVVEHHLRPLFGFFAARTLPTGLFISDRAIVNGQIEDAPTQLRLDQLIREAVEALAAVRETRVAAASS
jgi:FMN reductase